MVTCISLHDVPADGLCRTAVDFPYLRMIDGNLVRVNFVALEVYHDYAVRGSPEFGQYRSRIDAETYSGEKKHKKKCSFFHSLIIFWFIVSLRLRYSLL